MNGGNFHLLAFYTNDLAQNAANVALGAVTDQIIPVQNSLYLLPQDFYLMALYGGIDSPTGLRINMPSLLLPTIPYVDPISGTNLPANLPPIATFGDGGLLMMNTESISLEASRGGAGAADAYALMWMFTRPPTKYAGQVRTVQFTSTVTISEGTWAAGSIGIVPTLQAGTYAIVGMQTYGTNLLASRLVFSNQAFRPGCLAQGAQGEWNSDQLRRGNLGMWGTFTNTTVPTIQHFGVGAGTTQTGYLDLVKIG